MYKPIFFVVLLLIFANVNVSGQKKKTVRAKGIYMTRELTPEQARAKAIEDAKRNALANAGVSETVTFTDFSYKFEDNEKFGEIFQAISMIATGGEIIVDEILSEELTFNEFDNMVVEVEIEATIFNHRKKADPTFLFVVEGIDEVYKNEDLLQFYVTPTQDAYLKIFNITEDETGLLYPYRSRENPQYNDNPNRLFKAGEVAQLPLHPVFSDGYFLEVDIPGKTQEFNILLFVFTKQNIPFIEEPTFNNVMKWIYSISPDERVMKQEGFVIKK